MAGVGTITTCWSVSISKRTLTNCPGQSWSLVLGNSAFRPHGARRLIDLVVDDPQLALIERLLAVGVERNGFQGAIGKRLVDARQLLLRQCEQR